MKKLIFLLVVLMTFSLSMSQPPSKEELAKTSEHIQKLIKRDSLNALIIDKLKQQVDSLEGGNETADDSSNVATSNPATGGKIIDEVGGKMAEPELPLITFLLLSFGAGLLALFTPCVFPMIPLTVTFFTNSSNNRGQAVKKALVYGFSIIGIFLVIGITAGPFLANVLSTHWIPNLLFFVIFVIFGLSFLGLFDITLPSSFINKMDAQAEKGGMYGVFFMAFTLVLVSFSCTVPIVGTVLVESRGGVTLRPVLGMLAFSTAFAIPFTVFALFPELLKKLPKSGGWLNVIKVILGFIELALSLKFLSMIDQVYHLNILDREIYIAIWIVLFLLMGVYLLGKIKLPHDSEVTQVSVPRLILAMVPLVFVFYLIPGLFGAPLKALSGYLPPMYTHDFDLPAILRENVSNVEDGNTLCEEPRFGKKLKVPHGLKAYFTYEEAINCAKQKKLPVLLDFTGHACVSCREMEANVWSDPEVLKLLKQDYVIASLYVDDRTFLPKEEWYDSKMEDLGMVKTLGEKNTHLSVSKFGINAQPYYVLIDPFTEKKLVTPAIGYEPSIMTYLEYLKKGKENFNTKYPQK